MTDAGEDPTVRPYSPFPSLAVWTDGTSVSQVVDRFRQRFADLKAQTADSGVAMRVRATRWAAVDTGAIEGLYETDRGFTFSVATSTALLEAIRSVKGESVERAVEDALAAYDFVLDLVTTATPLSEVAIRELHEVVCRSQDTHQVRTAVGPQEQPLIAGRYKSQENHPLHLASNEIHSYAPVIDTPPEMARLIEELRSPAFEQAHPVQQAAYAHYAFVAIHPFPDGNGRVARAIASVFLYRDLGLPLVVFADEKAQYLQALEAGDDGRSQPLISFIGERVIDTVNLLREEEGLGLPPVGEQAAAFARELSGRGGYPHADVDAAAIRLLEAFAEHLRSTLAANPLSPPLSGEVLRQFGGPASPIDGFRPVPIEQVPVLRLQSAPPAFAILQVTFSVAVARGLDGDVAFTLYSNDDDRLEVFLREVLPRITGTLDMRLEQFADRVLRSKVTGLAETARVTLQQNGYV